MLLMAPKIKTGGRSKANMGARRDCRNMMSDINSLLSYLMARNDEDSVRRRQSVESLKRKMEKRDLAMSGDAEALKELGIESLGQHDEIRFNQ